MDRTVKQEEIELFLKEFETIYERELEKAAPDPEATFNYGWALIQTKPKENIIKGKSLLEGLEESGYSRRDCIYFIALGDFRLNNALKARKSLEVLLRMDPDCQRARELLDSVDDKINTDGIVGIGLTGLGIAAVAGVISAFMRGN